MGGGVELRARLPLSPWRWFSPERASRLPEVMLGILPAWGASKRLPP